MVENQQFVKLDRINNIENSKVFGGLFDLVETDLDFDTTVEHLKVTALLFENVVIQDSWFFAYGPIVDHLMGLGTDPERWENDDFIKLIEAGVVKIALRTGYSLLDVWERGDKAGVRAGEFLTVTKEEGDRFVWRLSSYADRSSAYVDFPKPIVADNKSLFGLAVEGFLSDSDEQRSQAGSFYLRAEVPQIRRLVDSFRDFVAREMSANFRRGQVEQFVGNAIGLKQFSYGELRRAAKSSFVGSDDSLRAAVAFELMQDISTIYAGTQSQLFRVRPQAYYSHDAQLLENYLRGVELNIREVMPNCVLDLRTAFSADALKAKDIVFIREKLGDGVHFNTIQKLMAACAERPDENSFCDIIAYLRNIYVPEIIREFPKIRVNTHAKRVANAMYSVSEFSGLIKEGIESTGVALGIIGCAGYAASTVGYADFGEYLRRLKELIAENASLEEGAAIFWGFYTLTDRVGKGVEWLGETAQEKLQVWLIKRAKERVDTWGNAKRNNYLTKPA